MAPSGPPSASDRLTDQSAWDRYWREADLPCEVKRSQGSLQVNAILDVLDAHLDADPSKTVLEVGGAPGRYLAYVHRRTGCRCAVLDYSPQGCALARRNFELLGIPLEVHERDLLESSLDIGRYDVVFSLGLIEHFSDLTEVVRAHARLVLPGGTLIVGAPNVVGVNGWFMRHLCPTRLAAHNPGSLRLDRWDEFERRLGFERRFRGHTGGFEPGVFAVRERRTAGSAVLWPFARLLVATIGRRFRWLRRFNHPAISGYLIGVYRVP